MDNNTITYDQGDLDTLRKVTNEAKSTLRDQLPANQESIPEMQRIKKAYPVVNHIPDRVLLGKLTSKFPNSFQPIAQKVMLRDKASQQGNIDKIKQGQFPIDTALEGSEDFAFGLGDIPAGAAFKRLYGAVSAKLAGKPAIEGIKDPMNQPSPGESAVKAFNLDLNKPTHLATAALIDGITNYGIAHLAYGVSPKVVNELGKSYSSFQGKHLDELKGLLQKELEGAGIHPKSAKSYVDLEVSKQFQRNPVLKNTPWAIQDTVNILKNNPGKLADTIKSLREDFDQAVKENPESEKTLNPEAISTPNPKLLPFKTPGQPSTTFGKMLLQDIEHPDFETPHEDTGKVASKDLQTATSKRILTALKSSVTTSKVENTDRMPTTDFGRQIYNKLLNAPAFTPPEDQGKAAMQSLFLAKKTQPPTKPTIQQTPPASPKPASPVVSPSLKPQGSGRLDLIKQVALKHASKKTGTFMPTTGTTIAPPPATNNTPAVGTHFLVNVETPSGEKVMGMTQQQLSDFRNDLKTSNAGIKVKDISPIDSTDPKFKDYFQRLKSVKDGRTKCQG